MLLSNSIQNLYQSGGKMEVREGMLVVGFDVDDKKEKLGVVLDKSPGLRSVAVQTTEGCCRVSKDDLLVLAQTDGTIGSPNEALLKKLPEVILALAIRIKELSLQAHYPDAYD